MADDSPPDHTLAWAWWDGRWCPATLREWQRGEHLGLPSPWYGWVFIDVHGLQHVAWLPGHWLRERTGAEPPEPLE